MDSENIEQSEPEQLPNTTIRMNRTMLVATVLISLVMGAIGGTATLFAFSLNSSSSNGLGGSRTSLSLPITQHLTLDEGSKFIDVAKQVNPSVVSISTTSNVTNFFGQVLQQQSGGTGFIITSDGLIATNKHVVQDQNASYSVVLSDGTTYDAKIRATDPIFDFAIVSIDAKNLKPVDFGDSDKMQVGQWVLAIGNALGQFQNSVSSGIISAKGRSIQAGDASGGSTESLEGLLQTNAAINLGNSGGPLLNLSGQVIGVNTATAPDAQSIGFSIPINVLKPAIDSMIKSGRIIRPALGVRYTSITKGYAQTNKLPVDHGAYIQNGPNNAAAIVSGGSADKAGLKLNDIITTVDNQPVDENHGLADLIQQYQPGQKITITYYRDGKQQSVDLTLQELPH